MERRPEMNRQDDHDHKTDRNRQSHDTSCQPCDDSCDFELKSGPGPFVIFAAVVSLFVILKFPFQALGDEKVLIRSPSVSALKIFHLGPRFIHQDGMIHSS